MASFVLALYSAREAAEGFADRLRRGGVGVAVVAEEDPRREGSLVWGCRVVEGVNTFKQIKACISGRHETAPGPNCAPEVGTVADQQCAAKTGHGLGCSNAAVSGSLCRHHRLVDLSRTPEGRASADDTIQAMDRRWRRDAVKKILERPDAAEIVADLTRELKIRGHP